MKKFNLSLIAILAMSTFAIAGGDIAPVEPIIEEPIVDTTTGNFYIGLGYGAGNLDLTNSYTGSINDTFSKDVNYDTVMLQAGYNFNPYIAVEARYWFGLDDDISLDGFGISRETASISVDTFGIYVRPQYPVTEAFSIYGLLGYANNTVDDVGVFKFDSNDGFSWGAGAQYNFNDNVGLFIDYVSMYNDDNGATDFYGNTYNEDLTLSTWNFGVNYNF